MVGRIVEGTLLVVIIGLVLANAAQFSTAIRAVGGVYTDSVKALSSVAGTGRG